MKKRGEQTVFSAGVWYAVCNIVLKGIVFLTSPIFNRLLTKTEVGEYSNFLSWANILLIIMTWELYSSVSNAKIDLKAEQFDEYMSTTLILNTAITGIFVVFSVIFRNVISIWLGIDFKLLLLLFLSFFGSSAISLCISKYRVFLQYKQTVLLTIILSVSTIVTSLILVLVMDDKYVARVIGNYVPVLIMGVVAYIAIFKNKIAFKPQYCKYVLGISVPLLFHVLAGTILNSSDRIIINDVCGSEDTALYSVAYTIVSIILILWTSITSAWIPWCYDKFAEEEYKGVKKSSKYILFSFAVLMFGVALIAPEVLYLLGGSGYVIAKWVVPPVLSGCLINAVYSLYVNIEQFYKRTVFVAIGTAIAAIFNIVLNFIFVPMYGYVAAAYTTFVSYLILFTYHFLIVKFVLRKSKIYDTKFVISMIGMSFVILVFANLLYNLTIVRYCFIGLGLLAMAFVIVKYRVAIFGYIKVKMGK